MRARSAAPARRAARARRRRAGRRVSDSPNTATASATVTTGSTVERIAAVVGPTRRSPAKNSEIAPTVEMTAMAAEPAPARRRTSSACSWPGTPRHGQRHRGAGADERASATDACARRTARRRGCRRCRRTRRPGASATPSGSSAPLAGAGEHEHEPGRERVPARRRRRAGEPLAAERDGGDGDDRRERVEHQRQQRGVDTLAAPRSSSRPGARSRTRRAPRQSQTSRRAQPRGRARSRREPAQRPEQPRRRARSASASSVPTVAPVVVGELAEDRHRAERGARRRGTGGSRTDASAWRSVLDATVRNNSRLITGTR